MLMWKKRCDKALERVKEIKKKEIKKKSQIRKLTWEEKKSFKIKAIDSKYGM